MRQILNCIHLHKDLFWSWMESKPFFLIKQNQPICTQSEGYSQSCPDRTLSSSFTVNYWDICLKYKESTFPWQSQRLEEATLTKMAPISIPTHWCLCCVTSWLQLSGSSRQFNVDQPQRKQLSQWLRENESARVAPTQDSPVLHYLTGASERG